MTQRLEYLDVAKGILILMVVIGHLENVANSHGIHNPIIQFVNWGDSIWGAFFMPAFFTITGYCSNFTKSFKQFLVNQCKSILLPSFTLFLISVWIGYLLDPNTIISSKMGIGEALKAVLLRGSTYWFLTALFVCKIGLYFAAKHTSNKQLLGLSFFAYFLGIIWHNYLGEFNPWFIKHALLLSPFIVMGYIAKKQKLPSIYISGGGYFALLIIIWNLFGRIPNISGDPKITCLESVPLFLAATTGTMFFLSICQIIRKNVFLEFIGKQSLIIYTLHISIIGIQCSIYMPTLNSASLHTSITIVILMITSTLGLSALFALLFSSKYFKYAIGKY